MASSHAISAELVDRVRTNINEPASNEDPQRGDLEIAQWLNDALLDYVSKVPADAIPELVVHRTFSGAYWEITEDYIKLLHVAVDHTVLNGTIPTTVKTQAYVADIDEEYMALKHPTCMGAWAKFDRQEKPGGSNAHVIVTGPNTISGTITYIGLGPPGLAACNTTFPLDWEHEEPIVNYATAMALHKINDEDAPKYLERYKERVAAEHLKYPRPYKVEREGLPQEAYR